MKIYSQLNKERIDLRKAIPLKKPFTILFEPVSACNFKCICCYYNLQYFNMPKGMMKWIDFRKIVDDLAAWEGDKIKVVRLIGFGEPLLHREIGEMVRYIKHMDVAERVEITTNGSLLTPQVSLQFVENKLDYLRISLYASTPEMHKKITKSNIPLETIIENIKKLREIRGDKESPFIYLKMLNRGEKENELFLEKFTPLADEVGVEPLHKWLDGSPNSSICPQPFKMLSIRYNGDVIVCDPDWENNTLVGNAIKENIKDIWNGENLRVFQKMQLEHRRKSNSSCKSCGFVDNEFYVRDKL